MKLHLLVTQERVDAAVKEMTVGEKCLFFEGEESRVAMRNLVARFMCDQDEKPMPLGQAKRTLNGLSDDDLAEAYSEMANRIMGLAVPKEPASAS